MVIASRRNKQRKTNLGRRAMYLLQRNIYTSCGKMCESFTKLGMFAKHHLGEFDGLGSIALPLVRRVLPQTFAQNIVGVQPMTAPVGISFAMRFIYKGIEQFNELV